MLGSICFRHHYAHHQELTTISLVTTQANKWHLVGFYSSVTENKITNPLRINTTSHWGVQPTPEASFVPHTQHCVNLAIGPTSYTGVVGHSDPAVGVEGHGCHFARTSRSVFVVSVVPRHRVVIIVVDVRAGMLVLQQTSPL